MSVFASPLTRIGCRNVRSSSSLQMFIVKLSLCYSRLSYLESVFNEASSVNKDLRRELELSKSKEVRKPFHHNSRRFEKKGISKRFFSDTRDESYSAEGVCDRTLSGEFLQYCILLLNCYFSWP